MKASVGAGVSTALGLLGAMLAFATTKQTGGLNANVVGWMLMALGAAGLLVSIMIGTADQEPGVPRSIRTKRRHSKDSINE
jgi:hypothetical protein